MDPSTKNQKNLINPWLVIKGRTPVVILAFFLMDLILGVGHIVNYLVLDRWFEGATYLLNLNSERSIATCYSSLQLFCIAVLAAVVVHHNASWKDRRFWALLALPILFLILSIDETMQYHEEIGVRSDALLPDDDRSTTFFKRTGIWMFIAGIPFLLCFLVWAYSIRDFFATSPGGFQKIIMGMLILLLGALGIEALSNFFSDPTSIGYRMQVFCEETAEMVGGTVILWGVYDIARKYIKRHIPSVEFT